ncbi:MAG: serine hydroxymethyltransferase [Bacilli bacterium]|nr:serine hydroxymethyltransferase [Bacilli bacterium]
MDKEIEKLISKETDRQNRGIELIASENYASKEVRDACGSILTNKYAEGYPGRRYYGGCEVVDEIESIAIARANELFGSKFANVQPHSGSQANAAAYRALMPEGGKVLSLVLNDGGHLTHGSPVSFSSHLYTFVHYHLDTNGRLDYENIRRAALEEKPNLILAGYSAYPYEIDFKKIKEIADEAGCLFMVDMAHIAGLVAAGVHNSPVGVADVVTSTTHKTLRGPRGGLILTNNEELAKKINSAIFPYYQGGPLEHVIAGKAICFKEALSDDFKEYALKVKENTKACADELEKLGVKSSGTENHLFLMNVLDSFGINGKEAQAKLEEIDITTNKNMIPGDTLPPSKTSGIRIGFAASTTRGCSKDNAIEIAHIIYDYLKGNSSKEESLAKVHSLTSSWKKIEEI